MKNKYNIHDVGEGDFSPRIYNGKLKINQNGITVISLVITIVILLILSSITINVGTGTLKETRMTSFVSYMQMIQTKVDYIAKYEDYLAYGEDLTDDQKHLLQRVLSSEIESFTTTTASLNLRYFDSNHIASDLEIENIDDEIVVDFNTREVISLNGIEYEGKKYYSQYSLPGGQVLKNQTEEVTRTVSFGSIVSNIDGLNSTFTITNIGITNGTLSYGRMDTQNIINWTTITNYTKSGESVTTRNITESGTYYFKLVDNVTGEDSGVTDAQGNITYTSVELRLTNSPKLEGDLIDLSTPYNYSNLNDSSKWAFATDQTDTANLKYYVWIPRFAYKLNADGSLNELQFLRGTSDITSSGGYINSADWTVPGVFTEDGVQKTGVWMQVASPNQTRYRYN